MTLNQPFRQRLGLTGVRPKVFKLDARAKNFGFRYLTKVHLCVT